MENKIDFSGVDKCTFLTIEKGEMCIYIINNNIKETEMEYVKCNERIEVAFADVIGCGILAIKIPPLSYFDCPLEPRAFGGEINLDIDETKKRGIWLNIIVVKNNVVIAERKECLGIEFSLKLNKWLKVQKQKPFSNGLYIQKITSIKEKYDADDFAKNCLFSWCNKGTTDSIERKEIFKGMEL